METKYFSYLQCFVCCLCGIIESVWLVDAASSCGFGFLVF